MKTLKTILLFVLTLSISLIQFGCKKPQDKLGVVEMKSYSINKSTGSIIGNPHYLAFVVKKQPNIPMDQLSVVTLQSVSRTDYYEFVYWSARSAADLGYSSESGDLLHSVVEEHIGGKYSKSFKVENSESLVIYPGDYGAWGPYGGMPSTGSGGTGGGNNSALCNGGYVSPLPNPSIDAQLDSYCSWAYALRCLQNKPLSDPQVQATCVTYNDFKDPSAPACPYCQ